MLVTACLACFRSKNTPKGEAESRKVNINYDNQHKNKNMPASQLWRVRGKMRRSRAVEIVVCQKGKCTSRVGARGWGKRHLTTAGLNYPAAECTGACVFLNVFVRLDITEGGLRPLAPGGEQQVREHGDYKNTRRQLALVLTACNTSMWWIDLVCHSSTGCGSVCVCVCPYYISEVCF